MRDRTSSDILGALSQVLGNVTLNAYASAYLLAVTTAPSMEAGRSIVRSLVERRLVACGTVIPGATSIYRWNGAIEETAEVVILLKTRVERWAELKDVFPSLHPYDVPELIVVPIAGGHRPYLDWLSAET